MSMINQADYRKMRMARIEKVEKITKHVPPDTTAQIFWLKNKETE